MTATRFERQPALDGLRAVAVGAVLLYHHTPGGPRGSATAWPGGFLGVDVFFVLSGYLITSLLLVEREGSARVDLVAFWRRRALRLLPAFFVMIVLVAAIARVVLDARELVDLRGNVVAAMFYVENWYRIGGRDSLVGHTWSLSIEEQWYLVWPIAFVGLTRVVRTNRSRALVAGSLAVASALWTLRVYDRVGGERAYFGTDTRAQSLLVGAALAFALASSAGRRTRPVFIGCEVAGLVGLGWLAFQFQSAQTADRFLYRGGFFLVAVASAAVVVAAIGPPASILRRVLSIAPLRAIGSISYGLYLFHFPLYALLSFDRVGLSGLPLLGVRVVASVAVAAASYRWIEQPIRRGAFAGRRLVALAGAMIVVVAATALATNGAADDLAQRIAAADARLAATYERIGAATPSGARRVLVAGDGTALALGIATGGPYDGGGIRGMTFGSYACGIATGSVIVDDRRQAPLPRCARWTQDYALVARASGADITALMVGSSEGFDRVIDGRRLRSGSDDLERYLRGQLDAARRALRVDGAEFVLLAPPCVESAGADVDAIARTAWVEAVWARWASDRGVDLVDPGELLCPAGVTAAGAGPLWSFLAATLVNPSP